MRQKLELEPYAHYADHGWNDGEDPFEESEDRLNEEQPWELAFEAGERMASEEMMDAWEEEEDWA